MPNKKNIKINKILVVGLGLIGASLCRKLKGHSNYEKIIGYDYDDKVMQYAHKNNYVDEICDNLKEGIEESDLVVLSVPVHAIKKILETVKYFFNGNKVFTDTLSTKDSILDFMIDNNLLETNNFILSHPMAGTENFGIKNSEDNLFNNAVTFICPLDFSSLKNIELEEGVVFIGEIGLAGQLRLVRQMKQRINEVIRLGYKTLIIPDGIDTSEFETNQKLKILKATNINQALIYALDI